MNILLTLGISAILLGVVFLALIIALAFKPREVRRPTVDIKRDVEKIKEQIT